MGKRMEAMPGVRIVESILHSHYFVGARGYDTRVGGVSTAVVVDMIAGGETVEATAHWYAIAERDVYNAIRWELRPRRSRVRRVAKVAGGTPVD